jgi:hypothetical protein
MRYLLLLLLVSCASQETFEEGWKLTEAPTVYVVGNAGAWCKETRALGCAIRHPWNGTCTIFITRNAPDWVMPHELKHCQGWDHI